MTKQYEALLFNSLAQILKNQTSIQICGKLTEKDMDESLTLSNDCIIAISKMVKPKEEKEKMSATEEENKIFTCWNENKEWHTHRKIQPHLKSIRAQLNAGHTPFEIKCAIINYITIVNDESYYYKHKSTLSDFMTRHLLNFLNTADPFSNYRKSNGIKNDTKPVVSNEEKGEYIDLFTENN